MDYDSSQNGMVCTICKVHGKPSVQARGAWVTRPINNWVKAKSLLIQHEKSDWHAAAIERMVMSQSTEEHGNVMEQLEAATAEEKKQNRDIVKSLFDPYISWLSIISPIQLHLKTSLLYKLRMGTSYWNLTERSVHTMRHMNHIPQ